MLDVHDRLYGSAAPDILGVPAYTFFVGIGILAGLIYYFLDLKRRGGVSEGAVKIVFSGLLWGVIGSRIPLILEGHRWEEILYGKSIVGGIVGGMLGVIVTKRVLGIRLRLGNVIAPAIALGLTIGRIGCFYNGCCYGIPAAWGFDFGDGLLRLPTQLFESAFHFIAFVSCVYFRSRVRTPGILFKLYILAYFVFRFLTEFIREHAVVAWGMTIYQIICGLGIVYILIILWRVTQNGGKQQLESY